MEEERKTMNLPVESNDAAPLRFRGKVDFQSHYLPPAYLEFLRAHHPGNPDGYPTPDYWTPDWQRDKMDLLGIAYAHLELSSPNVFLPQADDCLRLARKINDQGGGNRRREPDPVRADCHTAPAMGRGIRGRGPACARRAQGRRRGTDDQPPWRVSG
ncbi:hypothetical protein [Bifidobacterium myosotis]|uniref:hypothetical protein n=1 Tax=Bifidobacterium myosotis TaxID=1630166 RepID=UPI001CC32CE4|nr:hypothetical protein [Bifidobacterium myosotis]